MRLMWMQEIEILVISNKAFESATARCLRFSKLLFNRGPIGSHCSGVS